MNKPILYLMLGYPGAGKTTAAEIIAKQTGAVHLASDRIRLELFPRPQFTPEEHQALYQSIDEKTRELLAGGKSVIYDANLNRYIHCKEKYDICEATHAEPVLLWIQTPKDVAKQRAIHDSREHLWPKDETPADMFERIAEVIEPPHSNEKPIFVDGTKISPDYIRTLLTTNS